MRYLPHTDSDIQDMLKVVGLDRLDDLFEMIPDKCRRNWPLDLPAALTEWELSGHMEKLAGQNAADWQVFLGAGSQAHHIPALVPYLAGRSEFLTSYTPYQPEMSQGTLQGIFEFQTLISRLLGLEVTNASMYDGATAMAEAALMAQRVTKRRAVAVSSLVHPHWRQVLKTYLDPLQDVELVQLPAGPDGRTDFSGVSYLDAPAVLMVQSPNFFGVIEDLSLAAETIHRQGGLLAAGFSEPLAFGLFKSPGAQDADIAFGEGQSLGLDQGFGGPTLGVLSCKMDYVRQIPGRLVGQTTDVNGRRGYVLTLSTREQHIRRGRAVSNICSNAGHCALTTAMYMAAIGGSGFKKLARLNYDLAEYMKAALVRVGFRPFGSAATFNEFVLTAPDGFAERHARLQDKRILAGLPLASWYPALDRAWLFGVTETRSKQDIDALINEVSQ